MRRLLTKVGGQTKRKVEALRPPVAQSVTTSLTTPLGQRVSRQAVGSGLRLPLDTTAGEELLHRLRTSYSVIRAGLSKKAQAALPPLPAA